MSRPYFRYSMSGAMAVLLAAPLIFGSRLAAQQTPADNDTEVQALVSSTCSACHDIGQVEDQHLSETEWKAKVNQMIGFGAQVSDADFPRIVGYLAKHYGPAPTTPTTPAPEKEH